MPTHKVTLFRPYEFWVGQRIRIDGGPRGGDWEVIDVNDRRVRLRCPISRREFEWDHFCYVVQEQEDMEWPRKDG
jgi:hypothetical protein